MKVQTLTAHIYVYKHTPAHTYMYAHTYTHAYTCTCTVLVLLLPELAIYVCGPQSWSEPADGNKTGGPVGSRDISLIFPAAWLPQYSPIDLLDPWDKRGGVWPWVMVSEYLFWTLGHKIHHLHLVIRWLACAVQSVLNTGKRTST